MAAARGFIYNVINYSELCLIESLITESTVNRIGDEMESSPQISVFDVIDCLGKAVKYYINFNIIG